MVKWSCPLEFNDPLDVRQSLMSDFLNEEELVREFNSKFLEVVQRDTYNPRYANVIVEHIKKVRGQLSSGEKTLFEIQNEIESLGEDDPIRAFCAHDGPHEAQWRKFLKSSRIFCLTEVEPDSSKESSLMWAHYADAHSGIVFEFNVWDSLGDYLQEVVYSQDVPVLTSNQKVLDHALGRIDDFLAADFTDLFATKADCWSYEKEWRCVSTIDKGANFVDGQFVPFDPSFVTSITFGCRATEWDMRDMLTRCVDSLGAHIKFYQMQIQPKSFNMDRVQLKYS